MKIIFKLDPPLKVIVKNFLTKFFKLFYSKSKLEQLNLDKQKEDEKRQYREEFIKNFGVEPERVKEMMDKVEKYYSQKFRDTGMLYSLVGRASVLYDPEITDIHNEKVANQKVGPSQTEIMTKMVKEDSDELKTQFQLYKLKPMDRGK